MNLEYVTGVYSSDPSYLASTFIFFHSEPATVYFPFVTSFPLIVNLICSISLEFATTLIVATTSVSPFAFLSVAVIMALPSESIRKLPFSDPILIEFFGLISLQLHSIVLSSATSTNLNLPAILNVESTKSGDRWINWLFNSISSPSYDSKITLYLFSGKLGFSGLYSLFSPKYG